MNKYREKSQAIATSDPPDISVVLPTYNRAATLARAIRSVLDQTYQNFELIVIDDGSNDETQRIIQEIQDARLEVIHQPQNYGASAARNAGIQRARASWVAFQDSDDEWMPDKLMRQMAILKDAPGTLGVAYGNYQRNYINTNKIGINFLRVLASKTGLRRYRLDGNLSHALANGNFITTQSSIVRKRCLEEAGGFDPKLRRLQDWDIWLRIADTYQFAYIHAPLVKLHHTPGSISDRNDDLLDSFAHILTKHSHHEERYRLLLAQYHFAQADLAFHSNDHSRGKEHLQRSLQLCPTNTAYLSSAMAACLGTNVYTRWVRLTGLSYASTSTDRASM